MAEQQQQQPRMTFSIYTTQAPNAPPSDVTHASVDDQVVEIPERAFHGCRELVEINMNEGLELIGVEAFRNCFSLRTISVPSTVWKIGHSAFLGCGLLVEVDLPLEGSLREIGELAFLSCRSLQRISIPSTVETIGAGAFEYCQSLAEVSLTHGLKAIGASAFQYCLALTSISMPATVETIGASAFSFCQTLMQVSLNNGIKVISACTFESCVALLDVHIPSSVHTIGNGAFLRCTALVDVELPDGLVSIDHGAFMECFSLCAISIPYTTNTIGNRAFLNCTSLLGVELPSSKNIKLGKEVFGGCESLVNISIPTNTEEGIPHDLFSFCPLLQANNRLDENNPDPLQMQGRYVNLPIHEACHQVSRTTAMDLEALLLENPVNDNNGSLKDALGMTPFHIIAASDNRRTDLLELLLNHYPFDTVSEKDVHGKTMMDYLIAHTSSRSIPMIQMVLESTIRAILSGWGLDGMRTNMSLQTIIESIQWNNGSEVRRQQVDRVLQNLIPLVQVEVTSILELVLWKIQIRAQQSQCDSSTTADGDSPSSPVLVDRESCRTTCKADDVISNVVAFLWNEEESSPSALHSNVLPKSYCMI